MPKRLVLIAFFVLTFRASPLFADAVILKNGNKVEGVVTKETETSIEIQINVGAKVTFSKDDVERVERDAGEKNTKLQESWKTEKAKAEVDDITKNTFEEDQAARGLVKYEGRWITPEEKERLQIANLVRDGGQEAEGKKFSYKDDRSARSDFAKKLLSKGNWLLKESKNFSVFYRDASQAKAVSDKAEYYFEKIAYDLGYENDLKWGKKCQVFIVESVDKWKVFLKEIGLNPDLVGGFVPDYKNKEMFLCAMPEGYLAVTFPHELTHLILRDVAGKNTTIPLWLNEGLANYEANVTSVSNELLIKKIKAGSHILLGDLLRIASYPEGREMRELFYAQSEKLVEFLITKYGRKKFRKFCELILRDRSFKDVLGLVYEKDFTDMEDFNIKLVEYIVK